MTDRPDPGLSPGDSSASLLEVPTAPQGPWILYQRWHDLLFAHWPVRPEILRSLLPSGVELDLYHGSAWLGIVPFRMTGVRFRGLPPIPSASSFPELNVRTYVRGGEHRGVWFFSLDADSRLAVQVARTLGHLPYRYARMECRREEGEVRYRSTRVDERAPPAGFEARYAPRGAEYAARPGSLADFLTSRYCLFTRKPSGQLLRVDIQHAPWRLHDAEAELNENTMAAALGIEVPAVPPLLHLARSMEVHFWRPRRAG